jgi:glycolate oxidase
LAISKFIAEIKKIIARENIFEDVEEKICYSYDATGENFLPDLVVFPTCAEDISNILILANQYNIPVVPRGAGTGFTGGALPVRGGVVLAMSRMNRILEIDSENLTALVEPGVVTGKFQAEVEAMGLFYPPDPASLESSTLGGNVAECAGGPRAVKYGVTREYVLGLEAVLPTGEIVQTGSAVLKSVVGYDLTRLLIGSEGTLGVISKIRLKLLPLPAARLTLMAIFSDVTEAAASVSRIVKARVLPAALEFMDEFAIDSVNDYLPGTFPEDAKALLLIELDGPEAAIEQEAAQIESVVTGPNVISLKKATSAAERDRLWLARRSISPSLQKYNLKKINQDVVVPRSRIPALISGIHQVAARLNLFIINFGHAGDGNIHVNIMIEPGDEDAAGRAKQAVKEIFKLVIDLGGSISGEHGIGISKAPYLGMELSPAAVAAMQKIKKALDPKNILNPGKIFPEL